MALLASFESESEELERVKKTLISLVKLCEKETHENSGTVMFSKQRKQFRDAQKLVKELKSQ